MHYEQDWTGLNRSEPVFSYFFWSEEVDSVFPVLSGYIFYTGFYLMCTVWNCLPPVDDADCDWQTSFETSFRPQYFYGKY